MDDKNLKGNKAMDYISDYPLYASTCGITYDQAIAVAEALNPNWEQELKEMERFNKLSPTDQELELKRLGINQI